LQRNRLRLYWELKAALEQKLAEKRKERKTVLFGSPEFKKLGEEIKALNRLKNLNLKLARNLAGKCGKAWRKIVKSFTAGSIAALEKRGELQSAFSNAVVGSDTQKEIAVKLNEVNAQIKTAVDIQNEILGLNAEKKNKCY
jgi:hypothetical protein